MGETGTMTGGQFKVLLERCGQIYNCSWAIGVVRHDMTGKSRPVLVFHDETNKAFAHAFSFASADELQELVNRLIEAGRAALEKNRS